MTAASIVNNVHQERSRQLKLAEKEHLQSRNTRVTECHRVQIRQLWSEDGRKTFEWAHRRWHANERHFGNLINHPTYSYSRGYTERRWWYHKWNRINMKRCLPSRLRDHISQLEHLAVGHWSQKYSRSVYSCPFHTSQPSTNKIKTLVTIPKGLSIDNTGTKT